MNATDSAPELPRLVLDTNATLDWLVFGDPGMNALAAAIQAARLQWLASPRMRQELIRSLGYAALERWKPDSERVLTVFDRWTLMCPEPAAAPSPGLVCSDADDQVFIDLALAQQARWLVSHDRALHRLARLAAPRGLLILRPRDWQPP